MSESVKFSKIKVGDVIRLDAKTQTVTKIEQAGISGSARILHTSRGLQGLFSPSDRVTFIR